MNGTKGFYSKINICGNEYYVTENPEWIRVITDNEGKIIAGIRNNGVTYIAELEGIDIDSIKQEIQEYLEEITHNIKYLDDTFKYIDNPEFIDVKTDSTDNIVSFRDNNGKLSEVIGIDSPNINIYGNEFKTINDVESRCDLKIDDENKILSYRTENGMLVEEAGISTPKIFLSNDGLNMLNDDLKRFDELKNVDNRYHLPKYGTVDILTETFYLTQDERYSSKDDIEVRQDLPDTDENAAAMLTIAHYYIKNTDVRLDFYASSKVTKIGDVYYVTDTLVDGQPVESSIKVTQITDVPDVRTWPVDKKTEHNCVVDIDFGYYLNGTFNIGVKFQGSSTLMKRKRNFRFTFYKNKSYSKKSKIKIGEFIRQSGFNLKANWSDSSRIKEPILFRIILDAWYNRPIIDRFPWDKEYGYYTGATGFIKGFPISVTLGGTFYGMHTFSLKKDEKNYMLDGTDESGIFVCGTDRGRNNWKGTRASAWEDEMMDEMSQETASALNTFFNFINRVFVGNDENEYRWNQLTFFINDMPYEYQKVCVKGDKIFLYPEYGGDEITKIYVTSTLDNGTPTENSVIATFVGFNKESLKEYMDINGFIDYFIYMQTFLMWDSICRNMILHTRADKKKFYPYFYDIDLSLNRPYNSDIFDISYEIIDGQRMTNDLSLWENFKNVYWDEIVNRYYELRNTVLNIEHITSIYHGYADEIPDGDYVKENQRWGTSTSKDNFKSILENIDMRLVWLDEKYFIN